MQYVDMPKPVTHVVSDATRAGSQRCPPNLQYNVDFQYINGLSRDVTLVDQNGMRIHIPCNRGQLNNQFTVRISITLGRDVNLDITQLLNSSCYATRTLGEVIQDGQMTRSRGQDTYALDYSVTLEDIETKGGNLYLTNLDIVLSIHHGDNVAPHPRSEFGIRNRLVEEESAINDVGGFGYSLRIVDSAGVYGPRFININNQVYKVPVTKTPEMADGVYLTSSGPVEGDYHFQPPISKRYDFSEADEALALYQTVEEAKTLGDQKAQQERQLAELRHNAKLEEDRMKRERVEREEAFEKFKQDMRTREMQEEQRYKEEEQQRIARQNRIKEEIAQLEHQRNLRAMEQKESFENRSMEKKDEYESRSLKRKESVEIVKYLPAVFTGVLALFVAFRKS